MRARIVLLVASFLAIPFVTFGYTSPGAATGYVNDFAGLLSEAEKSALEKKLSDFDGETSNQIAVVSVPSLAGDTIENFAVRLFEEWGIGDSKNDNGVLLLVSRDDRQVRIEVGYGLEGALTDIQANDIIQNDIVPAFRNELYADGINRATDDIMAATIGEYQTQVKPTTLWQDIVQYGEVLFFFGFVLLQWLAAILARSKSWLGGGIVGGLLGALIGFFLGWLYWGLFALLFLVPLGLLLDYVVSSTYKKKGRGESLPWWTGGGRGGSGSSFGGFGGGSSGGGGASGSW
ncbi:MAG: TPM domain-containing protein [Patescibacteria group bacterium]